MLTDIERLLFNYSNARKSWESWCYLNNLNLKEHNPELRSYVEGNELLKHFRLLAFKDFHIEFYKLLKESNNSHDNIFKLLKEVLPLDKRYSEVKRCLSQLEGHKNPIIKFLNARDKYFAHLDPDYEKFIGHSGNIEDLYDCFQFIEEAIISLTSLEYIMTHLDKIPSRDEFILNLNKSP